MYYLTDTSPENGCLRVVPGSHRQKHPLHDADQAHDEALSRVDDPDDPLYGSLAEEKAVPVRAGDLVIGDSRLLHAAYANQSSQERSLITFCGITRISVRCRRVCGLAFARSMNAAGSTRMRPRPIH